MSKSMLLHVGADTDCIGKISSGNKDTNDNG